MRSMFAFLTFAALLAAGTPASAQPAQTKRGACFNSTQFESWKAADRKTIYIRVEPHRYFRLDLAGDCQAALRPGAFLITKLHGPDIICDALDWDLRVASSWNDIPQACIVKTMTELTPAEAEALPKNFKP